MFEGDPAVKAEVEATLLLSAPMDMRFAGRQAWAPFLPKGAETAILDAISQPLGAAAYAPAADARLTVYAVAQQALFTFEALAAATGDTALLQAMADRLARTAAVIDAGADDARPPPKIPLGGGPRR